MIPASLEDELSPAYSYGLIESVGRGRTDIDGGDQEHYQEDCENYLRKGREND